MILFFRIKNKIHRLLGKTFTPKVVPDNHQTTVDDWTAYYEKRAEIYSENANAETPKVSILVLTYNNLHYTKLCLKSIYCNTTYPNYEVIVADNASSDKTPEWLRGFAQTHSNMKLILNKKNLGFATGNNQMAREASGEYVVFLNNDTVVTKGWVDGLLEYMQNDPSVGLVGPVTNSTGNEARILTDYVSPSEMEALADNLKREMANQSFNIRMLAFYCVMARKDQYQNMGGLDERFLVGMFEDDDLAVRYHQAGLRVLCAEDVFIHHFQSISFAKLEDAAYQKIFAENRKKYEEKWGRAWEPYRFRQNTIISNQSKSLQHHPLKKDTKNHMGGKGKLQKQGRFLVGAVFSIICLYLAFRGIQFNELFKSLMHLDYSWVVLATVLLFASYLGRVWRWQLLFFPQKVRLIKVFHVLNIGYLLSTIFPFRLGDVARAYLIGNIEDISKARALSSIVIERLSDGLSVVLLLAIASFYSPNIPAEVRQGAISVAIAGMGGFMFLVLLSFHKDQGLRYLHHIVTPIPILQHSGIWKTLESFIDGFSILRSPRQIFGVAVWSLYTWVINGLMYWGMMRALGLTLPWTAAYMVLAFTALVAVVPSTPGYVGVFHYAAQLALVNVYGVDKINALGYAVVVHAFTYLWLVGLGFYSMWSEGLTIQKLQAIEVQSEDEKN